MVSRARILAVALVSVLASVGVAATVTAAPAGAADSKVPPTEWAAAFCKSFASYELNAYAAQQALQTAVTGVADSTAGAAATQSIAGALSKTATSAGAAGDAATVAGVPDVKNGKAITTELAAVLKGSSTVFTKAQKTALALPSDPTKLTTASKALGTTISNGLSKLSGHSKKLTKLDKAGAIAKAVNADPTCAAANTVTQGGA